MSQRFVARVILAAMLFAGGPTIAEPFVDMMYGVTVQRGITFGTGEVGFGMPEGPHQIDLLLDVFTPVGPDLPTQFPVALLIHSGGFETGDRTELDFLAIDMASKGYTAITIDYRLYTQGLNPEFHLLTSGFDPLAVFDGQPNGYDRAVGFASAILDTKKAISWIQQNAASLNVDTDRLIIGGGSAGARVALAVGLAEASSDVAGILSLLGAINNNEFLVNYNDPPFVLFNGINDPLVDANAAIALADVAQAYGVPFALYLEDTGHDLSQFFVGSDSPYKQSLQFFAQQLQLDELMPGSVVPEVSTFGLMAIPVMAFAAAQVAARRRRSGSTAA